MSKMLWHVSGCVFSNSWNPDAFGEFSGFYRDGKQTERAGSEAWERQSEAKISGSWKDERMSVGTPRAGWFTSKWINHIPRTSICTHTQADTHTCTYRQTGCFWDVRTHHCQSFCLCPSLKREDKPILETHVQSFIHFHCNEFILLLCISLCVCYGTDDL